MTSIQELAVWAKEVRKNHPEHSSEILDFLFLCQDEVEGGGSESHEVQLCYNDICDLVGLDQ